LMKLGGYGCYRVAMVLMPEAAREQAWIFLILTAIGVIYGAFSACVQKDLKYINAYSSVSHCSLVLFALLMMTRTAITGAVLQMLSHGLMTALFFALIGMIYARTHTRDIREMGGLMKVMPFLSVCYVIAGLSNLGLPGLSGFVAEMKIFVGAFEVNNMFHRTLTVIATASIVITAVYILRLIGKILYGPVKAAGSGGFTQVSNACGSAQVTNLPERNDATWDERIALLFLIAAIVAMGMIPWGINQLVNI